MIKTKLKVKILTEKLEKETGKKVILESNLKVNDIVKFRNPLNYNTEIAKLVSGATIKKIITIKSQKQADDLSLAIGDYFRKRKKQFEVAILDKKIAIPINLLTTLK